jgi:predicted Zn-dependent protease
MTIEAVGFENDGFVIEPEIEQGVWQTVADAVSRIAAFILYPFQVVFDFVMPVNPVTQSHEFRLIPTFIERWLGSLLYPAQLLKSGGVISSNDRRFGHYVDLVKQVGAELVRHCPRPELDFEFEVVASSVDNAWCLPGGKIAINLGLIQHMERDTATYGLGRQMTLKEKIAAVLSHEITHACARHSARATEFKLFMLCLVKGAQVGVQVLLGQSYDRKAAQADSNGEYSKADRIREDKRQMYAAVELVFNVAGDLFLSGLGLCKSRHHELEADQYGMHLLYALGSSGEDPGIRKDAPKAAIWLQNFFYELHEYHTEDSWWDKITYMFRTHPSADERIRANERTWELIQTN